MSCEIITVDELALRLRVTRRLVLDWTRAKDDPLPHFKRGRVKLFKWWDDCPDAPIAAWFKRHQCCESKSQAKH